MIPQDLTDLAGPTSSLRSALAEPYAYALVTWPAVIALLTQPDWPGWARVALGVWLIAMQLAAYRRATGFGNLMLLSSGGVALACYGHPSPWIWLTLPLLFICLNGAQMARVKALS